MRRLYRDACPVCNIDNRKNTKICEKIGTIIKEKFLVMRCIKCDCCYVQNPIHPDNIDLIYSKEYFHGKGIDPTVNYEENISKRKQSFFEKNDRIIGPWLKRYYINSRSTVLDVGAGLGKDMQWLNDRFGCSVMGVEISDHGRKRCAENGLKILAKTIELVSNKFDNYFDFIVCYEVMEHLYYPDSFMKNVCRLLKKNGKFNFSSCPTPFKNRDIPDWHYLRPEVHITFYSGKCIQYLFNKHGLKPINIKPNRQDNFKEKIKSGIRFMLNTLRIKMYQCDGSKI